MGFSKDVATIDFETLPIEPRPRYPPEPVGVAIKLGGRKSKYYAWGHFGGANNCSWGDARRVLGEIYDSGRPILYHHGKFDQDISEAGMQLPRLPWDRVHDTLPALFLRNPHASTYSLKPSAEAILGWDPEERDELVDWLVKHQPISGTRLTTKGQKTYAGAFVAWAPGDLAGRYACGDTDRTWELAVLVLQELKDRGMLEPYDRERRLIPKLLDMERHGVRIDVQRLGRDVAAYERQLQTLEYWLAEKLSDRNRNINLNSGAQLVEALIEKGFVDPDKLELTPSGNTYKSDKASLKKALRNPQMAAVLAYRAQLGTCMRTFMRPWLATARSNNGRIFTTWKSTRATPGGRDEGARTGRLASSPNFQNIPTQFDPLFFDKQNPTLPKTPSEKPLKPLPLVRQYLIPDEMDWVLCGRDYSQQELRILGHYEGGVLCDHYNQNPWLDVHNLAQRLINEMLSSNYGRKPIKTIGFGLIYGMGVGLLAERIGATVDVAKQVKGAYLETFPGLRELYREMRRRADEGLPVRTHGGREFFCEEAKWINGRLRKFDYKMVNYLIQGSAADCTKEALCRYIDAKPAHHRCLLNVHDEILISAPREERDSAMECLREAMESVKFDIPMLSEGAWSDKNWASMKIFDKKGVKCASKTN
ncbi:MAG: DNA polymerase [Planctomycetota bacterium]|jgi:DNA polymerase-1